MNIKGKVALVTGGASGIGRATSLLLAEHGAQVVVADVAIDGAAETVHLIEKNGGEALAFAADITQVDAVEQLFAAGESRFGGIDIVINNAGIVVGPPGWPDVGAARLAQVIHTNLGGVFIVQRTALDSFAKRGGGVVVNTSSQAALVPLPTDPAYGAAKAGVVYLTRASAGLVESHNVRVVAMLPGMTQTPMLATTGDGEPAPWLAEILKNIPIQPASEVAQTALDLIQDDSLVGVCRACRGPDEGGDFDLPD
ncbi:MAG: SDR family oxidoreductase [Myxococcota bacterium]